MTELDTGSVQTTGRPVLFRVHSGPDGLHGAVSEASAAGHPAAILPGGDVALADTDLDGSVARTGPDQFAADLQNRNRPGPAELALGSATVPPQTTTAYETLFQALQLVFAQANSVSGATGGQRYTELLQSLAKAG